MPCIPFKNEAGFGFVCSDIGYEKEYNEYFINTYPNKIKQYKYEFIRAMKAYTQCPTLICYQEVMAHIENVGYSEINFKDTVDDMQECISYWSE